MGDVKDNLAERVAAWMRGVMRRRNWTAERWARLASTSPTNITRFLSHGGNVPSTRTLMKLSAVAGEPPPLLGEGQLLMTRALPLCSAGELRAVLESKSWVSLASVGIRRSEVLVPADTPQSHAAVRVEIDTMSAAGIAIGDTLVIELLAPPAHGQVVCALIGGKLGPVLYAPPYAIPQSTSPAWRPMPLDQIEIVGVVKQQLRTFN